MDKVKNYSPELLKWFEEKFPGKKKLYYFTLSGYTIDDFEQKYNGFILPFKFIEEVVDESMIYPIKRKPVNENDNYFYKRYFDDCYYAVVAIISDIDIYNVIYNSINDYAEKIYNVTDNDIDSYIQYLDTFQLFIFDGLFRDITVEIKNKLIEYYNIVKDYIPDNKEKYDSKTYEHYLMMLDYTKDTIENDVLNVFEINI